MIALPRLYAIADASFGDPVALARCLFEGGARLVQIRNKKSGSNQLLRQLDEVLGFAPEGAIVIVNDRTDVALLAGAGGVHLGQDDLPADKARNILGPRALIGVSTHNLAEAVFASKLPADYIAVGPIYPTTSKENTATVLGLEELQRICASVHKPVVAIGGITRERAPDVFAAGAASVAVIGDLLRSDNIAERTRSWIAQPYMSEQRRVC